MDKDRAKKMKAAIAAVLSLIQDEKAETGSVQHNRWARAGRELIMKNRMLMQRREYIR